MEDEGPEEGAPKCLSFLSQVCVCVCVCVCWKECSQLQEGGRGWTFELLGTE